MRTKRSSLGGNPHPTSGMGVLGVILIGGIAAVGSAAVAGIGGYGAGYSNGYLAGYEESLALSEEEKEEIKAFSEAVPIPKEASSE